MSSAQSFIQSSLYRKACSEVLASLSEPSKWELMWCLLEGCGRGCFNVLLLQPSLAIFEGRSCVCLKIHCGRSESLFSYDFWFFKGNHGNNGNNGATGHEGAKGEKGDKGDLGPRGERGQHGPKGEKGYPGVPPELQVNHPLHIAAAGALLTLPEPRDQGPKGSSKLAFTRLEISVSRCSLTRQDVCITNISNPALRTFLGKGIYQVWNPTLSWDQTAINMRVLTKLHRNI